MASAYTFNKDESWAILSAYDKAIRDSIISKGIPLVQWNIKINRGILTGLNEAFIISSQQKDALIAEDPKSAEVIRPILRGRDIKRYELSYANMWLINIHNGVKANGIPPVNINRYPAIKRYMDTFIDKLNKRGDHGDTIYNLRNCAYLDDFFKQKIVYREIGPCMDACIVEPGTFVNNKCYIITGEHLIYLIAVFNSKLFNKIYLSSANITGGKGIAFLNPIHIPVPSLEDEKNIIALYNKYMNTTDTERNTVDEQIEEAICKVFELNQNQTQYILTSN